MKLLAIFLRIACKSLAMKALFLSAKGIVLYSKVKSFSLGLSSLVFVVIPCILSVNYLRLRSNLKLTIANCKTRRKHSHWSRRITYFNISQLESDSFFSLSLHIYTDIKLATLFPFSFCNFSLDSSFIVEQKKKKCTVA